MYPSTFRIWDSTFSKVIISHTLYNSSRSKGSVICCTVALELYSLMLITGGAVVSISIAFLAGHSIITDANGYAINTN